MDSYFIKLLFNAITAILKDGLKRPRKLGKIYLSSIKKQVESIREIYRIGHGPSSSHTMGPRYAAQQFLKRNTKAQSFTITLYGSLAATGKGHLTDAVIRDIFNGYPIDIVWMPEEFLQRHPNALKFEAVLDGKVTDEWLVYSVGGGKIVDDTHVESVHEIYPLTRMDDILKWCEENGKQLWEYVYDVEGNGIEEYLVEVWNVMQQGIERGLTEEGVLPGVLKLPRKAAMYHAKAKTFSGAMERRSMIYAYALATSEENAAGNLIVTAPTCGGSGALPAVLYYMKTYFDVSDKRIYKALATAALVGNLVKSNASISGAEVGCQGEVGTACAMASAAVTQLFGGTIYQVEYAAEMGIEHHLGLTCDPVAGLVQIPCIERNAFAASRALNHSTFVLLSDGRHRISFDEVVETMKTTGHDLHARYRETSTGGLAVNHKR
jgi:L-serine dehydratase